MSGAGPRVLLVNAPFGPIAFPHLGTSLVKASAVDAGFHCDVSYASIEFAKKIGFAEYETFCKAASPMLLQERLFAKGLSDGIPSMDVFYNDVIEPFWKDLWPIIAMDRQRQTSPEMMKNLEQRALHFVEEFAARPAIASYDVVAFSSSYGQHVSSLAIARKIKQRHPDKIIVFGGANCEGPMGLQLVRSFDFVDYAFSGDGDVSFPKFLAALRDGEEIRVPGVVSRAIAEAGDRKRESPMRLDMDTAPVPDFSDYFPAMQAAGGGQYIMGIPFEGSRGCWWGEKHHCTFCGLNGLSMKFRAKSPERFVRELRELVERYGQKVVLASDNILDSTWVRSVLPGLAENRAHDLLFLEVKANLKKSDLEVLAKAGSTVIQPGIESLSTHVLKLIDKGTTSLQNVQLLKWAHELGISVIWNFLCGIPGEKPEDYEQVVALMEKIPHLEPPFAFARISVDRFSPYHSSPEKYGIRVAPTISYRYVYDLPADEIANLAYWHYYECENGTTRLSLKPPDYARSALHMRAIWEKIYGKVAFSHREVDGQVVLEDTRPCAVEREMRLDALESEIFRLADAARSRHTIAREISANPRFRGVTPDAIDSALEALEARNILHREADKFLALATSADAPRRYSQSGRRNPFAGF